MQKLKGFFIAVGILILVFIIAFFATDIIMKIIVGHRNEVIVPDLQGMNYEIARKKCKELKLYVTQTEIIYHEEIEKGKIISQTPNPEIMTKKYRTINVIVSDGPELVRIPYLDNLRVVEAKLKLENAGLTLGEKSFRYSEEVTKGKIIYSQPMADELIPKKSSINIVISLGKYTSSLSSDNKWKNLLDDTD
jgi:serine/threonine-protein kinase